MASSATPFALSGCEASDPATRVPGEAQAADTAVDDPADEVVELLRRGSRADLLARGTAELNEAIDGESFDALAAAIRQLGELESSHVVGDVELEGGGARRSYLLRFAEGDADFELSRDADGAIVGLRFSGADFSGAQARADAAILTSLSLTEFKFTSEEGLRREYRISLSGILAIAGSHHLTISTVIRDAGGEPVYGRPIVFEASFPASPDGMPTGSVQGVFDVQRPGPHEVELTIKDDNSGRVLRHRVPFVVRSSPS